MKKYYLLSILAILAFSVSAQNLVLNPGFEAWDDATHPTSWTKAENVDQESVAANVHSGTYSAKHTGGTKDIAQDIAVTAEKEYQLSFWYKVVPGDGDDSRIWCVWEDGSGAGLYDDTQGSIRGPDGGYLPNGTGEWLYYSAIVTAPAAAAALALEVRTYSGAVTYWDDFVFEELADVAPPVVVFSPLEAATSVAINSNITLTFDEAILNVGGTEITDASALVELKLTDNAGADVASTVSINAEKTIITIDPDADLANDQVYYAALKANVVEDAAGNAADLVQSASFTTIGVATPVIEVTYPAGGEAFYPGQDLHIDWNAEFVGNITIWVSFDAGGLWAPIVEDISPTTGTVDYTIPTDSPATLQGMIRITEATNVTFLAGEPMDDSEIFAIVPMLSIYDIQSDVIALYEDTVCITTGIVSYANGKDEYYISDGIGGDYSGVVVRDDVNMPVVGDSIVIAGTVDEYYSLTQMTSLFSFENIASGKAVPAPVDVTTGGAGETLEGVIVKLSSAVVVTEANNYGEAEVDDGSGVILTDDPYYEATLNLGGTYDITGPLSYSYGDWRVYPTAAGDVVEIPSAEASVTSDVYTVDDAGSTITAVPALEDLATLEGNIVPVYGATFMVYEADGTTVATDLQTGYQLIVTSQDSNVTKAYVVTKDPLSDDASVTSVVYTVDDGAGTIAGVLYKSDLVSFEALVIPAAGATFMTYQADGTTEATDVMTDYKLIVTAEDGATTKTYTITVDAGMPGELIFSEYIEGSGNNKAIEIFNPNDEAVRMDYYQLAQISNGGDNWEYFHVFPAGTILGSHENYVIITDEVDVTLFAHDGADEVMGYPSPVHHNGDDARGMVVITSVDTTLVDIIGEIGPDPGDGWDVAGVTNATKEHTLLRKGTVMEGNTDWASSAGTNADNSEWIVMDQNYFDSLGYHTLVIPLPSDDATLSDLMVDGTSVTGFSPAQLSYFMTLTAGTTDVPVVTATATDDGLAIIDVTPATDLGGDEAARTTSVLVTAEDGTTEKTYTVLFTVEVGVENSLFNNVNVYPVPAVNKLYMENIEEVQSMTIFDITGAAVMNVNNSGQSTITLDVSSLNSGIYMVRMTSDDTTGVVRFIKE